MSAGDIDSINPGGPEHGYLQKGLLHESGSDGNADPLPTSLTSFDELSRESRNYSTPECFEGFRVSLSRHPGVNTFNSHTIKVGEKESNPAYEFAASAAFPKAGAVFNAQIDSSMAQSISYAQEMKMFGGRITGNAKMMAQIAPDDNAGALQVEAEVRSGDYWVAKGTFVPGMALLGSFMGAVTRCLSLGAAVHIVPQRGTGVSVGMRHVSGKDGNDVFTAVLVGAGVQASFARKVDERTGLAAEIDFSPLMGASEVRFGAEHAFHMGRIKASVSTSGKVASSAVQMVGRTGIQALYSAEIDHAAQDYKFGMGLVMQM